MHVGSYWAVKNGVGVVEVKSKLEKVCMAKKMRERLAEFQRYGSTPGWDLFSLVWFFNLF